MVWRNAIEGLQIFKESRLVLFRVFAQRNVRFPDALDNLVLDIGDVHHLAHSIPFEFEITAEKIGENKCSKTSHMRDVVNPWLATVDIDLFFAWVLRAERF